jgi:hypothetical protein
MKVRHKGTVAKHGDKAADYDVLEESPSYYIVRWDHAPEGMPPHFVSKADYEPVPTETWRDVSSDCDYTEAGWQISKSNNGYFNWPHIPDGYRLRKVKVNRGFVPEEGCVMNGDYAFIVEKREP